MSHVTQVSCIPHTTSSAWAPKAHKQSQLCCLKKSQFCCVKYSRATPCGANFRASESKASSSLECSAERSRKSTKLKLVCEYRPGRPGFKSSLLRRGGFRREVEPLLAGEDG